VILRGQGWDYELETTTQPLCLPVVVRSIPTRDHAVCSLPLHVSDTLIFHSSVYIKPGQKRDKKSGFLRCRAVVQAFCLFSSASRCCFQLGMASYIHRHDRMFHQPVLIDAIQICQLYDEFSTVGEVSYVFSIFGFISVFKSFWFEPAVCTPVMRLHIRLHMSCCGHQIPTGEAESLILVDTHGNGRLLHHLIALNVKTDERHYLLMEL
jgi:hypothetical protein